MQLPWVSRERLNESLAREAKLEDERRMLIDRIVLMSGQAAIYHPAPPAAIPVVPAPPVSPADDKPLEGPLTFNKVIAAATAAVKSGELRGSTR